MHKLLKLLLVALTLNNVAQNSVYALSVDEFVPGFLKAKSVESSETDPEFAFSIPARSLKRNASQAFTRTASSGAVFATPGDQGANNQYFDRNNINYDKNALVNFNITNSNQSALQSYSPRLNEASPEQQLKNKVAVPIQADKNTSVSVGQQQIELNIKY